MIKQRLQRLVASPGGPDTSTGESASVPSGSARGDYRPALDGVRAVAVLLVIAFHVTNKMPAGGFLGVDVFFVLSGYLITTLLLRENDRRGRVRLLDFWGRRARRLLPAVLILVAACAAVVAFSAPLSTYPARRSDMLSTLLYYANWHFIATSQSYFAAAAGASPLRHTWSLAIEEQFYVAWPLIFIVTLRLAAGRRRAVLGVILVLAAYSVIRMAALADLVDPTRSYYGTDTRAQSLLIGAALAVLLMSRPAWLAAPSARKAAAWAAPVCSVVFVLAILLLDEKSAFYYDGGSALFAIAVATGLWALETRPKSPIGALLSSGPVRWIGSISYGLYLWHWPLIIWLGDPRFRLAHHARQALEVLATFAIATLSYELVERPIREGRVPWLRLSARRLAPVAVLAVAVVALVVVRATTFSSATANELTDYSDSACPPGSPSVGYFYNAGSGLQSAVWCSKTQPTSSRSPVVAVIGDSTSRALDPGMVKVATQRGWRYIQAGTDGCSVMRLILPAVRSPAADREARSCQKVVPRIVSQVRNAYHPDVWVVADLTGGDPRDLPGGDRNRDRAAELSMRSMLQVLTEHGARVVLALPSPLGQPLECVSRTPAPDSCNSRVYTTADPFTVNLRTLSREAAAGLPGTVALVDVDDILCPGGRCRPIVDGMLARYDGTHYTGRFSRLIVPTIIARAEAAGISFRRANSGHRQ